MTNSLGLPPRLLSSDDENPNRIAVIGAGAVGLCSALNLRRDGHAVDVLDPRPPGEGASLGNAGIIATCEVLPLGRPATLAQVPRMLASSTGPLAIRPSYLLAIAPWLARFVAASRPSEVQRLSQALASLLSRAMPAWSRLVQNRSFGSLLSISGWLRVFPHHRDLVAASKIVANLRRLGVRAEILGPDGVRDLEPALVPMAGGLFFPEAGHLHSPIRMMRALAHQARSVGIRFETVEVATLEAGETGPVVVSSDGARRGYDRVVVAAGAWSRRLLEGLGARIPLDTERGYHAMLPVPPQGLNRPVTLPVPGYTLAQMTDGLRLTSGVEFAGLDAPADFRRIERMINHAARVLPDLATEPLSRWLGFRPSMPDSIPVIGPLTRCPSIVLAFGHGHLGVTLAPLTGEVVADLVAGRDPPVSIAAFSPARFGA